MMCDEAAPYFGQARAAMPIVWSEAVPIMGVDKQWRCYVNPQSIVALKPAEIAYVLLHEVSHLLRKHADRAQEQGVTMLTHTTWNTAADCEINTQEYKGLTFPACGVKPANIQQPDGLLAEDYYSRLMNNAQSQASGGSGKGEKGDSDGSDGQGQGQTQPGGADKRKGKASGGSGQGKAKSDIGGSGSDGLPREWELPADDAEDPGLTPLEIESKILETAEMVRAACKTRGDLPGGWQRWAGSIVKPVVKWQNQLRHVACSGLSRCGLGAQTYRRIRERDGMAFPRWHKRDPIVAIVADTSGSMGAGAGSPMQRCLSEVIGIAKHLGQVNIIWTDAESHLQQNVRRLADVKCVGGGGTDMTVGIKFANALKNGKRPDIVITLTDGYTPWSMPTPKIPHVAVIIGGGDAPQFGKVVRIEA